MNNYYLWTKKRQKHKSHSCMFLIVDALHSIFGWVHHITQKIVQKKAKGWCEINQFLKPHQVASMLGVHPNTLRNWVALGILTERRTPTNHRLFDRKEIEELQKQIQTETKE